MDKDTRAGLIILGVGAAISAPFYAYGYVVHRREKAKREEIRRQTILDLDAIKRAADHVIDGMDHGKRYSSVAEILQDLDNQIAFEKIAIREE